MPSFYGHEYDQHMGHRYSVVFYECILVALVRCGRSHYDPVRSGIQRTADFIRFRSYKWVKKLTREDA